MSCIFKKTDYDSEEDDEYDDYAGILKPALYVADLPDDFDPNKIPETGEEYLQHVRYELKQCKEWTAVDVSSIKFAKKQNQPSAPENPQPSTSKESAKCKLPSIKWQVKQIKEFEAFRSKLSEIREFYSEEVYNFNATLSIWKAKLSINPKLSEVLFLHQNHLSKLLEICLDCLKVENEQEIPRSYCIWIFSVLACMKIPLTPEDCYTLREIARSCMSIWLSLQGKDPNARTPFNILICIIAKYFNNLDLLDDVIYDE